MLQSWLRCQHILRNRWYNFIIVMSYLQYFSVLITYNEHNISVLHNLFTTGCLTTNRRPVVHQSDREIKLKWCGYPLHAIFNVNWWKGFVWSFGRRYYKSINLLLSNIENIMLYRLIMVLIIISITSDSNLTDVDPRVFPIWDHD